jgi:hypothetical protein
MNPSITSKRTIISVDILLAYYGSISDRHLITTMALPNFVVPGNYAFQIDYE